MYNIKIFKEEDLDIAIQQSVEEAFKSSDNIVDINIVLKKAFNIFSEYQFIVDKEWDKSTGQVKDVLVKAKTKLGPVSSDRFAIFKRSVDLSSLPVENPFYHKSDRDLFIKTCLELFPNTDAYTAGQTLTNFRKVLENIHANIGTPGAERTSTCLYQYSMKGGSGKSFFQQKLNNFMQSMKLPSGTTNVVGRWINSTLSYHIASTVSEFFPPKGYAGGEETIINLNNIIDNLEYKVEGKGKDPVFLNSRTTLFLNSNKLPFDENSRRYGIVKYNEFNCEYLSKEDREKYFYDRDWNKLFLTAFESCPFGEYFVDEHTFNSDDTDDLIYMARRVVQSGGQFANWEDATIRTFAETYANLEYNLNPTPQNKKHVKAKVMDILSDLIKNDVIKPSTRVNGSWQYSKYDWVEISELPTNDTQRNENVLDGIENIFERTRVAFYNFLTNNTATPPDNDGFKLESTEETLENGYAFKANQMSKPEYVNNGQQFVCVNKETDAEPDYANGPSVKDADVFGHNFVCECDNISKEEQIDLIENLPQYVKDAVLWVTDSGSKSIHCIIRTNNESSDSKLRKFIHGKINERFFNGNLDTATYNAGRLCRNPNAIRDNGNKQQCLYMNKNAKPLDVSQWIKEFEKASSVTEQLYYNYSGNVNNDFDGVDTLEGLKKWNESHPSKAKQEAIEFLEGNLADWNRCLACGRSLIHFGFTASDILSEAQPNDEWVAMTVKKLFGR